MQSYFQTFINSYEGYWNYLKSEILMQSGWDNYFYGLIIISLVVFALEIIFPWRKNQAIIRKDFWLDTFYMFFNFFILNLIVFIALSNTLEKLFVSTLSTMGIDWGSIAMVNASDWPLWISLPTFLIVSDFVQWWIHRLLHRSNWLWKFHKVHHSVKEMGFAAHLRYHWMEPVVYKSLIYIPIALIGGFEISQIAIVHFFTLSVGHLNHANIGWDYHIFKYIFNNPKMHIWHHAKHLPKQRTYGVNFGLTLSIWDYLFKTNYIPHNGKDIELGFDGDKDFPKDFISQQTRV